MCPDLSKQGSSGQPQGYPEPPTPTVWHSAMVPGYLCPNVTLLLAILMSNLGKRPPLSGPRPPQETRGDIPMGTAGRRVKGAVASLALGQPHFVFLISLGPSLVLVAPPLPLLRTPSLNLC